jgi:hypothetical protein
VGLTLCVALGLAACVDDGAAPVQFGGGGQAVFFGHVTGRLAVQVEAVRRVEQGLDVGRAGGVAVQEDRQRLAAEDARCALLNVGLHTQLDGQHTPGAKQRRKAFCQLCGAGGGGQVGGLGGFGFTGGVAGCINGCIHGCIHGCIARNADGLCWFRSRSRCGLGRFSRFSNSALGHGIGRVQCIGPGRWRCGRSVSGQRCRCICSHVCICIRAKCWRGRVGCGARHGVNRRLIRKGRRRVNGGRIQGCWWGLVVGGGQGCLVHGFRSGAAKCRRRLSTLAGVAGVGAVNLLS